MNSNLKQKLSLNYVSTYFIILTLKLTASSFEFINTDRITFFKELYFIALL